MEMPNVLKPGRYLVYGTRPVIAEVDLEGGEVYVGYVAIPHDQFVKSYRMIGPLDDVVNFYEEHNGTFNRQNDNNNCNTGPNLHRAS